MIETIETGSPKVLGLKLCGKLHDEDYKLFVPKMETILTEPSGIKGEGKVRLFVQFDDYPCHGEVFRQSGCRCRLEMAGGQRGRGCSFPASQATAA